jgi:hypothetical protein
VAVPNEEPNRTRNANDLRVEFPMTPDDSADDRFLFVVEYDSDAERKRVEYLFDNLDGDVSTLDGLTRITEGVDQNDVYERLVSKVPDEQVSAFRLDPLDVDAEPERTTVEKTVSATPDAVEGFVEYMFSKKKAVLQSAARNEYEVYTKKGRADVAYELREEPTGTAVRIRIEGYPPAPGFLADFFETELTDYAESQQT